MGARGKVAQTDNANNQSTSEANQEPRDIASKLRSTCRARAEQSKRTKHQLCQAYEIA